MKSIAIVKGPDSNFTNYLGDLEIGSSSERTPLASPRREHCPSPTSSGACQGQRRKNLSRGDVIGFVKVHPFKHKGRYFTVKPVAQTGIGEVNVEDYVRNPTSSLSRTFEPMAIMLQLDSETTLSRFVE